MYRVLVPLASRSKLLAGVAGSTSRGGWIEPAVVVVTRCGKVGNLVGGLYPLILRWVYSQQQKIVLYLVDPLPPREHSSVAAPQRQDDVGRAPQVSVPVILGRRSLPSPVDGG